MGWKRRFGNRAEADLSPEEIEAGDHEVLEETAEIGKPEHYLLNNKIFPGNKSEEVKDKEEDLRKKEVELQKMICILLCTVFPLVTTLATVLRLWQSGMFVSSSTPSPPPQHITVTDCPSGWLPYNHTCLHHIPGALTWSEARDTCHKLSAKLPSGDNTPTETSAFHKFIVSKFPSPLWMTSNLSRNSDRCRVLTAPTNGGAAILEEQCVKKLTGVCIKAG